MTTPLDRARARQAQSREVFDRFTRATFHQDKRIEDVWCMVDSEKGWYVVAPNGWFEGPFPEKEASDRLTARDGQAPPPHGGKPFWAQ